MTAMSTANLVLLCQGRGKLWCICLLKCGISCL